MQFGEKLKKLRTENGFLQEEVANKIGVSRRTYISYEKDNVRPRQRATYEKLANVLGCEPSYLLAEDKDSVTALAGPLTGSNLTLLAPLLGYSLSLAMALFDTAQKNKAPNKTKGRAEQHVKKQKKFQAAALGIIVKALVQKGIRFHVGNAEDLESGPARPDEFITIEEQAIKEWWFRFWAFNEGDSLGDNYLDYISKTMVSSFCVAAPDPNRKVSIVVDNDRLLEELSKYQSRNSYRGNMSIILIDVDNARIVKEELLSSFNIEDTEDKLCIL